MIFFYTAVSRNKIKVVSLYWISFCYVYKLLMVVGLASLQRLHSKAYMDIVSVVKVTVGVSWKNIQQYPRMVVWKTKKKKQVLSFLHLSLSLFILPLFLVSDQHNEKRLSQNSDLSYLIFHYYYSNIVTISFLKGQSLVFSILVLTWVEVAIAGLLDISGEKSYLPFCKLSCWQLLRNKNNNIEEMEKIKNSDNDACMVPYPLWTSSRIIFDTRNDGTFIGNVLSNYFIISTIVEGELLRVNITHLTALSSFKACGCLLHWDTRVGRSCRWTAVDGNRSWLMTHSLCSLLVTLTASKIKLLVTLGTQKTVV